jgi:hypothetical protein
VGTVSEIASEIYQEFAAENEYFGIWEESVGIQTVCIPTWSPLKTLHWLSRRARSPENSSRFLFFQDSSQAFHFTSIPKMKELYGDEIMTYRYMANNLGEQTDAGLIPNTDQDMKTIIELDYLNSYNIKKAMNEGVLHNTSFITDITRKRFVIQTNTYWDTYGSNGVNPKSLWEYEDLTPGNIARKNVTYNANVQPGFNERVDETDERFLLDTTQQIEIVVFGNSVIDVGQIVNIEIPPSEPEQTKENELDQRWSGKYYVIGKRDFINFESHKMALRLTKDSNL